MEKVLMILKMVIEKGPEALGYVSAACLALAALFMMIPGEQPEKALKGIADFVSKFSKKPPQA